MLRLVHTLCLAQMYMSTAVQYTAAAVLGVYWLNRERDMFREMYQQCKHRRTEDERLPITQLPNYVQGAVPIMFRGLCQALCSVMWRGQLFILTNQSPECRLHVSNRVQFTTLRPRHTDQSKLSIFEVVPPLP